MKESSRKFNAFLIMYLFKLSMDTKTEKPSGRNMILTLELGIPEGIG